MDRRDFFQQSLSVIAIPTSLGLASSMATAADQVAAPVARPASNTPLIAAKSLRRLPKLPGRLDAACFSPDGQKVAIAVAVPKGLGAAVYAVDLTAPKEFQRLTEIQNVRTTYSISWEATGERLALSTWGYDETAANPYETRICILNSTTGDVLSNGGLTAEKTPIDKKGVRTPMAWLDANTLVATQEGSLDVYTISLKDLKLVSIYKHPEMPPKTLVYGLAPVALGNGAAAAVFIRHSATESPPPKTPQEAVAIAQKMRNGPQNYEPWLVKVRNHGKDVVGAPLQVTTAAGMGSFDKLLMGTRQYYRAYLRPQGAEGSAWIGEFVERTGEAPVARIPAASPFAADGFELQIRTAQSLSAAGDRLVLLETDLKPAESDDEFPQRNPDEPHGRLVVVDLESSSPH